MADEEYLVLDDPRIFADEQLDREIVEDCGTVMPYSGEGEQWCAMPVRLVWDQAGGLQIELGPYTLPQREVDVITSAISSYYPALWAMQATEEPGQPDK
jgi:hypothetical protein